MPLLSHSSLTTTRYFFFSLPFPVFLVSRSPSFFFFFLFSSLSNRIHLVGVFRDQFVGTREDARCAGSAITESVSVALGDFRGLKWRGGSQSSSLRKSFERDRHVLLFSLSLSLSHFTFSSEKANERGKEWKKGKVFTNIFFFQRFRETSCTSVSFYECESNWKFFFLILLLFLVFFKCGFVIVWNSYIVL